MNNKYNITHAHNLSTSIFFKKGYQNDASLESIKMLLENDDKYEVYPSQESSESGRQESSYQEVARYVYQIVKHSNFLCKGLNEDYVKRSMRTMDAIVVIGQKGMDICPNGNVYGFALIQFDEQDNSIYVDVICSHVGIKGAGDALIRAMEHISRTLFITHIKLKSVADAISFYEKYGFVKQAPCENQDELCEMNHKIMGGKRRSRRSQRRRTPHPPKKTRRRTER